MNISIVGTGYVGLVSGTCFSEMGNHVWCIDIDQKKIDNLKKGKIPIYEPGLEEMVLRNHKEGRLDFTTDYAEAIPSSDICFIAVGTPPGEDGSADTRYVLAAAESIAKHMCGYTIVVDKSTVPVGTSEKVRAAIQKVLDGRTDSQGLEFDVVSNPEFLKEGVAVNELTHLPQIISGNNKESLEIAQKIFRKLTPTVVEAKSLEEAELIKLYCNTYRDMTFAL